ncbi:MAG: hypothetical protein OXC40_01665, partial [Proteobacteria bacterium]|nr:hypothetical protein [Pseudomonadota bacterium]
IKVTVYCMHCQEAVVANKHVPNHAFHLMVTICTFGLWGLIWLCFCFSSVDKQSVCTECGLPTGN